MNDRIQELAKQAGIRQEIVVKDSITYLREMPELEKFAELIVADCITQILKESKWYWDKEDFDSSDAIRMAARRVHEHFKDKE